ncbi:DUF1120 domain-containing protein [Burkholderia contaminans]|uniref:DUF1120 domain-containing protein n=1 Tax=Burkholderia contaminans TaxID=488447 RepID=UPI00241811A4|nr:DUF1120 domain-containing protein [Burkholderia contaminans]WFN10573.1 DUF1120 domain-containing protein [Burkholderia contaminans]
MSLKKLFFLSVSVCSLSNPCVTSAADLSVNGHIQPSGACSIALGNGGTVDLGTLSRKDLNESDTKAIWRQVKLAIDCQNPAKVAIKAINNRETLEFGDYGLGPTGSKNQSRYWFYLHNRYGDDKPLLYLRSLDGGQSWGAAEVGYSWIVTPSSLSAWAEKGETLPQAFRTIRSTLDFLIVLPAIRDLDLSQEIALDGSATLELVYL